jgi:hypothetical protein
MHDSSVNQAVEVYFGNFFSANQAGLGISERVDHTLLSREEKDQTRPKTNIRDQGDFLYTNSTYIFGKEKKKQ